MPRETCLYRVLASTRLRHYLECMIVVWCPWVLFLEREAVEFPVEEEPRGDW